MRYPSLLQPLCLAPKPKRKSETALSQLSLTLPLESVPHNRGHELACLGRTASQFCSNRIGLT